MVKNRNGNQLKDSRQEQMLFTRRAVVAGAGVLGLLGLLGARMGQLQISGHQRYMTMSQANRVKLVPVPPNRGLIHDRNGVVLAENRPTFQLLLTPEQIDDMPGTLEGLRRIIAIEEAELQRFQALLGRSRRFQSLPLKFRLTETEVSAFATQRHRFPGVEVEARLTRHYPHGPHAVHAIGYVGRINERELQRIDANRYAGTSHMGKTGVEMQFEERLHGHAGLERVETNALGRVIRPLERVNPNPGQDIYLTIDSRIQRIAEEALGDYAGSIVAIDIHNGDVLALASTPMYDPNLFVHGIDVPTYRALQEDLDRPLFNRALRGQYPPGSTIKPFFSLAALKHGIFKPSDTVTCNGFYTIPGVSHRWRCWRRYGHGRVDMTEAIVQSCDVYFYDLAYKLGIDRMHEFLDGFGFGHTPGLGMPGELSGILPSREWKRTNRDEGWFHGETIITGIGQGYFLTTPLQLAQATAVLASRGDYRAPRILKAIRSIGDEEPSELPPVPTRRSVSVEQDDHWEETFHQMEEVVHGKQGTARSIAEDLSYRMAGKTGTAQVFSIAQDAEYNEEELEMRLRDHALYNCFFPADTPRFAVAVVVENGGSGGGVAAPIAKQVSDACMAFYSHSPPPSDDDQREQSDHV